MKVRIVLKIRIIRIFKLFSNIKILIKIGEEL